MGCVQRKAYCRVPGSSSRCMLYKARATVQYDGRAGPAQFKAAIEDAV